MIQLFFGACCIGFAPIFVNLSSLGPSQIAFYRCIVASFFLFFIFLLHRLKKKKGSLVGRRDVLLFALTGFVFCLDLFVWHKSVRWVGAGLGTILGNTQVFYLGLIGMIFLGERPSRKFFVAVVGAFVGVVLLSQAEISLNGERTFYLGIGMGLLTGFFYATYITLIQRVSVQISPTTKLFWILFFAAVFILPLTALDGPWVWPVGREMVWILGLALGPQILGWVLITKGLAHVPSSVAGLILLTQPVVATLFGWVLFDETFTGIQMAGAILTLGAIYIGSRSKSSANLLAKRVINA